MNSIILALVFLIAPLCWLLVVRTLRLGLGVGAILVLIAVTEFAVAKDWLFTELATTTLVLLIVIHVAVLIAGFVADASVGGRRSRSRIVGLALGCAYCLAALAVTFMMVVVLGGERSAVPPSDVLPSLPPGLTIVADTDMGCRYGSSSTSCDREFQIGSTDDAPAREVAEMMVRHLRNADEWQLAFVEDLDWWSGTRREGWGLDRSTMHVWVKVRNDQTIVTFGDEARN
ncbi:hypothetical protein ACFWM1_01795 [Nocardia sp. NPDC058379]|uniref:hypothetical protein n=1 Tax=unclassified Nocardia TaxID=2637762 RepID=UPI0036548AAB